jgi:iron complex outermembrane receptor protein
MYGHWTRAHRSGGYNLRNTAKDTVNLGPGPFDQETVDNFEIGYKSELAGGGRLNAAVFLTDISDMQRELNLSDPDSGVVQVIKNTADAEIWGVEVEGTFPLGDSFILMGSIGWIDPSYTKVLFDLNGDGVIDQDDKNLKLPRAAELTWNIGLNHIADFSNGGSLSSRINYAYRDDSFYNDSNLGYLLEQEILNLGFDYRTPEGHWIFSLYGRNLLGSVKHGGDTQLPVFLVTPAAPVGGTFSPLSKGEVVGFEVTFNY